ncbi:MAG: DUF1080 domain-containing protein [Cyclobacteriaceae bacterium]|nr:DUF1080 domain-containing protein [Cyclobacteriaceae bacterium]
MNRVSFLAIVLLFACKDSAPKKSLSLFNGTDLSGWHWDVPALDSLPQTPTPFVVRQGLLVSLGEPNGHLLTDSIFENYQLDLAYRFAGAAGNCGVLVHASTPRALYKMFPQSIEVQLMHENAGDFWCIVENIETPDMETRRGPKEKWGITEGMERRIKNLTDGTENPLGEWNTLRIQCHRDTISVWVNEVLVNKGWHATAQKGRIALQAEGAEVEFKDITLTALQE